MIESSFSIKLITNPLDKDYLKSLSIYNSTTPVNIKTNSNEITYWITPKNNKFKIYTFSLFIGDINIGFAMAAYLFDTRNLVIDYIAIDDSYRNNTVFLAFFNLVQIFFQHHKIDINYTLIEISNKNNGADIDRESTFFLKFLCLEEFSKVDHEYISLPLGTNNTESGFSSYLYIRSTDRQNTISKDTFLSFIRNIYYDYYLEWYKPLLSVDELNSYNCLVQNLLSQLTQELEHQNSLELKTTCCHVSFNNTSSDTSRMPITKSRNPKWFFLIFAFIICLPIPLIWAYNFVLEKIGIPINSVNALLGGVLSATITGIISFFVSKKRL